jgi:hypothetical protein
MPFEGIHIRPDSRHPDYQPYSRGLDLLGTPSATGEDLFAAARDCATASIDSNAEDSLSVMAATLYRSAQTVAGRTCTSGECSSGKIEVDKASFKPEYAAEVLYGPDRGKEEETIQRVISLFEFLNVEKFLKRHTSSKRPPTRETTSSRATTPTRDTTSSRATTPTQATQGE